MPPVGKPPYHAPMRQALLLQVPPPPDTHTSQTAYGAGVCVSVSLFLAFAGCMLFSMCMSDILHIGSVNRNYFYGHGSLEKQILQCVHLI